MYLNINRSIGETASLAPSETEIKKLYYKSSEMSTGCVATS